MFSASIIFISIDNIKRNNHIVLLEIIDNLLDLLLSVKGNID